MWIGRPIKSPPYDASCRRRLVSEAQTLRFHEDTGWWKCTGALNSRRVSALGDLKAALAKQCPWRWSAAAKALISRLVVARGAGRIDEIVQLPGHLRIEDVPALFERLEAVGVENLRPQIAVIGGRIAARENMLEMRSAVTHGDAFGHADPLEFLLLERNHIYIRGPWIEMEFQIDQRRRRILDRGPALIVLARLEKLAEQRLRHGLARLVMQRKAPQHFRLNHPMLVELGGKLHEITCDMSAGNHGIGDVGKHAVQSVAEFVEQRPRIVGAQQTRFALAAFGEIHHIDDDWQLPTVELLLAAEIAHPRPASL